MAENVEKTKKRKKKSKHSTDSTLAQGGWYRLVWALPKNLIYVGLCITVTSFAYMIYVIVASSDLDQSGYFKSLMENVDSGLIAPLTSNDTEEDTKHGLNAFYSFWQKQDIIEKVPYVPLGKLTMAVFYKEILIKSRPLFVTDGCASWSAITKWPKLDYLQKVLGSQGISIDYIDIDADGVYE